MTTPNARTTAADALLDALTSEASQWASDTTGDQQLLDAVAAAAPGDKLALLQSSNLLPSHLSNAIGKALAVLDPATYATPAGTRRQADVAFRALATVMVCVSGTSVKEARTRVEAATGEEIDPDVPRPDGVRVCALTIEPGTVRLAQPGEVPVTHPNGPQTGAPATLLPPAIRAGSRDVVDHCWNSEERDFADQDDAGRAGHIFPALRLLRSYLDTPAV
ncbi:hypothetical protein [Streptomyces lavenduligriseus]|uniref:Uncharacterized protein n=1 Tax=Streptomyces lavenduligriseus TaxID=67315 RepID=A0ABT0P5Y7_9ACTN|nr:hypothetical protein [Streptomyces lavenduligriseus]MCL3999154.1 hypothetical protein [Streptomyces lavenduligriseus]